MDNFAKKFGAKLAFACVLAMPLASTASAEGDAVAGENVFKRCKACHQVGEGAKNSIGPQLNGVVGRAAASVEDYKYGTGLIEAAEKGLVWDEATLLGYLEDPKAYLVEYTGDKRARAKMVFKLRKEEDRKDVIAYLATLTEEEATQ